MVTPPGIPPLIPAITPTSPAPELSLTTKLIVTKELGKPTTSAPVLCMLAECKAPKDRSSHLKPSGPPNTPSPKAHEKGEKAPTPRSPTRPKKALNPEAYKFRPIAQKESSRAKVWAFTLGNKIPPSADIRLSGIKAIPVVEDKPQIQEKPQRFKPQAPMWTGPS